MSWQPCADPRLGDAVYCSQIETVIVPRARDLGGFSVRRALPSAQRQMVGPFIFFDQMGPAEFLVGSGLDVRPHPHIGLATVTYLFAGEIMHRDSLGTARVITPGAVNLMTAGRGIVHSERTTAGARSVGSHLYGIQSWVALPLDQEENEPAFSHYAADDLPVLAPDGARVRVIAGVVFGERAPTQVHSDMLYADIALEPGARLPVSPVVEERALFTVSGEIAIAGDVFPAGQLLILRPGDEITVVANSIARFMLFGGAPMDGPRFIWWNFVSAREDRIAAAKADWAEGRFAAVPGETQERRSGYRFRKARRGDSYWLRGLG